MQEFEQLYSDYNKDIYRFLLKISGYDFTLAEELTQETFYQAFISMAKFQGRCQIKTWLCQIAKNIYYQHLRKKKREHITVENENETITSLESKVENAELIQNALAIINSFDDRTRDVMLYRFYSDLPYSQISLLLGISEGSTKVVFFRGKALLQTKLREDFGYEI
ncbi:RNA polymerase sigma-70 factor (ECF subfamily) [Anaerotaenia torta]|uniref:RNA polymerase sigma factor n=1 Tax=Anaerotaenia torta TaxID=433293 RepID=UPI003D246C02